MEVRSNGETGKYLFNWHPETNSIDIVKKGMFYRIELYGGLRPSFKIVDKRPWDSAKEDQTVSPKTE